MVKAVIPEVLEEGFGVWIGTGDGEAGADNVLGDDLGDAVGKGVVAPGVKALGEDIFVGILRAVKFGGVEGGGTDKEGVLGFCLGESCSQRRRDGWPEKTFQVIKNGHLLGSDE